MSVQAPEKPQSPREARKQAKAELAAAKARAKAARPFWKKPLFWIAAVIVVAVISSLSGGGSDQGTTTGAADSGTTKAKQSAPAAPAENSEAAGIGEGVADGQFTFTVNSFDCGAKKIGRGFLAIKAQGQFCIADMAVENTGDQAAMLDSSSQYAYIDGKEYTASSDALMADKRAEAFFIQNINPGNSVEGIVVWDVPVGQSPDTLELHDSPFSGGVTVQL